MVSLPLRSANSGTTSTPPFHLRLVAVIYALAVALRLWRFFCSPLTEENAIIGMMGQDLAKGRYPFFFYGQGWMGGLDSLLTAPLLSAFGPAAWILNLWPHVFGLLVMVVVHRLLVRLVSPAGVLVGLLYLALPPAGWLFWSGYAQNHFSLGVLFCALLMLLTAQLNERTTWGKARSFLWGLCAGLAVYTFPQAIVVVVPCFLFLLACCSRQVMGWPFLAGLAGLLLGAAPIIYFNLAHGWTQLGQAQYVDIRLFEGHLGPLFRNALPIILGLTTQTVADDGIPHWMWLYLPMLALSSVGLLGLAWQGLHRTRVSLLAPALVAVNIMVLLVTIYGRALATFHQAYLLPLYLALPLAWGWLGQWAASRRAWPAQALVAFMVAAHLAGYPHFSVHQNQLLGDVGSLARIDAQFNRGVAQLRAAGLRRVYASPSYIWSFYGQGDPVFSDPWEERAADRSFLVDASLDPAFWLDLEPSLAWLGLPYQKQEVAGHPLYHAFALPSGVEATLPREGWRSRDLEDHDLGNALNDGDLGTGFATPEAAMEGQGFVLDLGDEREIAGLALLPARFDEMPAGLLLETAGDDGAFETVAQARGYWGPLYLSGPHPVLKARHARMECYFAPRRARYLRLTHLGKSSHVWSVREVLAWGPGPGEEREPSWEQSGRALLALLEQDPPVRVWADTWPAALIQDHFRGRMATTPGNTTWDNYGGADFPPGGAIPFEARANQALVATRREAPAVEASLDRLGAPHRRQEAGRLVLFRLTGGPAGRVLPLVAVESPVDTQAARALADGLMHGRRWGSQGPQRAGMRLEVDLGQPRTLAWVELDCPNHPQDYPRELTAQVSEDGQEFRPTRLVTAGPLEFSGQMLFTVPGGSTRYQLPDLPRARFLRLILGGSNPVAWWSVQRLRVLAP